MGVSNHPPWSPHTYTTSLIKIFPTKLNNVTDKEFTYFRASKVVASKSSAENRNTISRPYYGEKVFIKSGEYTFIEQLINEIKTKLKDKIILVVVDSGTRKTHGLSVSVIVLKTIPLQ